MARVSNYIIFTSSKELKFIKNLRFNAKNKYFAILKKKAFQSTNDTTSNPEFNSYKSFVSKSIESLVKYVHPNLDIVEIQSKIYETVTTIINITSSISNMIDVSSQDRKYSTKISMKDLPSFENGTINYSEYFHTILTGTFNTTQIIEITRKMVASNHGLEYFVLLNQFLSDVPMEHLKLYIWWSFVEALAAHTTEDMRELQFQYSKNVTNVEGITPRSMFCAEGLKDFMNDIVTLYMIDTSFLNETIPRVEEMVENIKNAFKKSVDNIDWLDEDSQYVVSLKIGMMQTIIGISERLKNSDFITNFYRDVSM